MALPDRALAFDVRRPRFQPDDVLLLQLQFGGVLDRDDALGSEMKPDSMLSSVVLPEPVPPVIIMFSLRADAVLEELEHRLA